MPPAPLLYESHCHTPLCKHARGEPIEYAAAAERRGLKGIVFTCHCPLPDGISLSVRMAPGQYDRYIAMVAEARERFAGRVDVRLGLESDYLRNAGMTSLANISMLERMRCGARPDIAMPHTRCVTRPRLT